MSTLTKVFIVVLAVLSVVFAAVTVATSGFDALGHHKTLLDMDKITRLCDVRAGKTWIPLWRERRVGSALPISEQSAYWLLRARRERLVHALRHRDGLPGLKPCQGSDMGCVRGPLGAFCLYAMEESSIWNQPRADSSFS